MSAFYIQKLIETVQGSPERTKLFTLAPGAGDLTVVTGASGFRTRVFLVSISAEADAADVMLTLKDGTVTLDQKPVPKKSVGDFEWRLADTPWWLAPGADLVLNKDIAPVRCSVAVQYDVVAV